MIVWRAKKERPGSKREGEAAVANGEEMVRQVGRYVGGSRDMKGAAREHRAVESAPPPPVRYEQMLMLLFSIGPRWISSATQQALCRHASDVLRVHTDVCDETALVLRWVDSRLGGARKSTERTPRRRTKAQASAGKAEPATAWRRKVHQTLTAKDARNLKEIFLPNQPRIV